MPNGSFYNLKGNIYYYVLVEKTLSSEMVHFTFLIVGLYYSYGISDQKMVRFIISKVIFTIVSSMKSHGQVKWYILPFQLMYVLFLWYIRPEDGSFDNLKGKIYYCTFSEKLQSSRMVNFTFPIDVCSFLMVYHTRKGSQIHFQLLLV